MSYFFREHRLIFLETPKGSARPVEKLPDHSQKIEAALKDPETDQNRVKATVDMFVVQFDSQMKVFETSIAQLRKNGLTKQAAEEESNQLTYISKNVHDFHNTLEEFYKRENEPGSKDRIAIEGKQLQYVTKKLTDCYAAMDPAALEKRRKVHEVKPQLLDQKYRIINSLGKIDDPTDLEKALLDQSKKEALDLAESLPTVRTELALMREYSDSKK